MGFFNKVFDVMGFVETQEEDVQELEPAGSRKKSGDQTAAKEQQSGFTAAKRGNSRE